MKDPSQASNVALSDTEAVERARSGDHEAFRVLVERYQDRVFRLALRVLRDEEQARDASQEAFLKAYRALRRFEGRSSFYTWLYRLVLNLCLDMRRRDKADRHVEWEEERPGSVAEELAPPAPDPSVQAERSDLRRQIAAAMDELPEDARQTLILREIDGLSYAEIAKALEIPKGTVMSRLHYARKRLSQDLEKAGITPPGHQAKSQDAALAGDEN